MAKDKPESSSMVENDPQNGKKTQVSSFIGDDDPVAGFTARLRAGLGDRTPASVARKLGYPPQTFDRWIKDRIPRADDALRIAKELGLDLHELLTGMPDADRPSADLVYVPRFDLKASAGPGRAVTQDAQHEPEERVGLSREWLRRLNVEPQFAELLFSTGDSMEPTIRDGDMMLINRAIRTVETAGIYVVTIAGMMVVKRAFWKRDGSLVLKSDNPLYPEEVIPPDELYTVTIEGRVRWAARSM